MSTTAGLAVGLAAASAANSACSEPMTGEQKTALAVWIVGAVVAFLIGASVAVFADWREQWRYFDPGHCVAVGGALALAWGIGAPVVALIWGAFGVLFGGGG